MEKTKLISLPLICFLLCCHVSIFHSRVVVAKDQTKTCPVKFETSGTCAGPFGVSECYQQAVGRFGQIPPKGCQCIPNGANSGFCLCNIVCP